MALTLLAANNAQTVLAAGISASATSLTVNSGTGSLFPAPSAGVSFFKLTLIDAATGQLTEIVHVTARSGDTMTIDRAQEGTTARAWSANDIAANMMTAGTLSYVLSNFQPLDATLSALAGLATGANKLPYFTGTDLADQTDFTSVGRDIVGQGSIANVLTYLGLGEAAKLNVGTTAGTVAAGNDSRFNQQIGVAQAWQDVTAQRQLGVTYTNTTGRPIQVLLDFVRPAPPASWNFGVKIDSVAYPIGGGSYCPIVPAGSTYSVISQGITQYTWRELR